MLYYHDLSLSPEEVLIYDLTTGFIRIFECYDFCFWTEPAMFVCL